MGLLLRRFCCISLRTASVAGLWYVMISAATSLLMRVLDMVATADESFVISRGFNIGWRSHQATAFLVSDVVVFFDHVIIIFFSAYMYYIVTHQHYVLYAGLLRRYNYCLILLTFVESCFALTEFGFYGKNTFRRDFLLFTWFWWIARIFFNGVFVWVLFSRSQEMEDETAMELRGAGRKYRHSYA